MRILEPYPYKKDKDHILAPYILVFSAGDSAKLSQAELVVIDEAAAIPLPLVKGTRSLIIKLLVVPLVA